MENVEGVEAEEATVEPVENQAEPEEVEVTEEGEPTETENAELTDEELDRVLNDPKAKAKLDAKIAEEVERKTARQKAANRQLQKKVEELQKLREQEPLVKPKMEDFDTDEEYDKAVEEYDEKRVDRLAEEKALEKEAEKAAQEQWQEVETNFKEREAAFIKETPDYAENTKTVQEYLNWLPKDENGVIKDEGAQAAMRYILTESENGPALLNLLGSETEKLDALLGKPPAWIVNKIKSYEKDLTKKTEIPQPLPTPPKKSKGAATTKNLDNADSVLEHLGLRS